MQVYFDDIVQSKRFLFSSTDSYSEGCLAQKQKSQLPARRVSLRVSLSISSGPEPEIQRLPVLSRVNQQVLAALNI